MRGGIEPFSQRRFMHAFICPCAMTSGLRALDSIGGTWVVLITSKGMPPLRESLVPLLISEGVKRFVRHTPGLKHEWMVSTILLCCVITVRQTVQLYDKPIARPQKSRVTTNLGIEQNCSVVTIKWAPPDIHECPWKKSRCV
jgi:hypothetical protein